MEEIKDSYLGMEVHLEEIAIDLRDLPTDYKLAERYRQLDQEIYEISEWYEKVKKQRKIVEERIENTKQDLRTLNHEVKNLKLQVFSHDQHGGSYSRLSEYLHR
jgi:chromosome segregation ATPase